MTILKRISKGLIFGAALVICGFDLTCWQFYLLAVISAIPDSISEGKP